MRRNFLVASAIASLVIGLGWQVSAFAGGNDHDHRYGPHAPAITTSSSVVDPGDSLTVNCKNFAPNEKVTFTLGNPPVFLGKTTSNDKGSCSIEVTIPNNTNGGTYTIVATGKTGDSASTEITVVVHRHHHDNDDSDQGNQDNGNNGVYWDSVWKPLFT